MEDQTIHRIGVGMSGGVDSAVTAALLKEQEFDVVGIFMKNWSNPFSTPGSASLCRSEEDFYDVRCVCEQLEIPFYTLNFEQEYKERVFKTVLEEYRSGRTPNPDILCNSEIKFRCFLDRALEMGMDRIATGHYARVQRDQDGKTHLLKGKDEKKDQSYFLSRLTQEQLRHVLFPLGAYRKTEVRELARLMDLPVAEKKDSQGICFIGEVPMKTFLSQFIPASPGNIKTADGRVIGEHEGLPFYTIGQRKGIGIGGGMPYYVAQKNFGTNELIVVPQIEEEGLFRNHLTASNVHWIHEPRAKTFRCCAKIRYRQEDQHAQINIEDNAVAVEFDDPQRAITPGQSIVFYWGEEVLGSAIIDEWNKSQ